MTATLVNGAGTKRVVLDGEIVVGEGIDFGPLPDARSYLSMRGVSGIGGYPAEYYLALENATGTLDESHLLQLDGSKVYGEVNLDGGQIGGAVFSSASLDLSSMGGTPLVISAGAGLITNLNADKVDGYHASGLGRLDSAQTWADVQTFTAVPIFNGADVPFVVVGEDQVDHLNANYLQDHDGAYYLDAANMPAGVFGANQRMDAFLLLSGRSALYAGGDYPSVFGTAGGGAAPFDQAGNLVLQSRGAASRAIYFATGGASPAIVGKIDASGNVGWGSAYDFGGGVGVGYYRNATTAPTSDPSSGFLMYSVAGVANFRMGTGRIIDLTKLAFPKRLTADVALSASTNVSMSGLDVPIAANEAWLVDYEIHASVSGGTAGLKPFFTNFPSGATGTIWIEGHTSGTGTYVQAAPSTNPGNASATAFITASFDGSIRIRAAVVNGANAGNIRLAFATGASAAGNIKANSNVMAMRSTP